MRTGSPIADHFAIGNYAGQLFNNECVENTSWPRDIAEVLVFDRALSPPPGRRAARGPDT